MEDGRSRRRPRPLLRVLCRVPVEFGDCAGIGSEPRAERERQGEKGRDREGQTETERGKEGGGGGRRRGERKGERGGQMGCGAGATLSS